MKIDITELLTNRVNKLSVHGEVVIPKELLIDSRIDELQDVSIDAKVYIDQEDELIIEGNISGLMILKDDITLEPVQYRFNALLEENLNKEENLLDITDVLWQNILVEVPSKVRKTNEDIYPSGDGWRVISEDTFNKERTSNNPFANLDELLKIKEDK